MQPRPTRRLILAAAAAVGAAGRAHAQPSPAEAIRALEAKLGGRIGVAALDAGSKARIAYRADERFPMTSTFKMLAAAFVLARVDRGDEDLERRILFSPDDLVPYSPATKDRTHGQGMSLAELCEAAVVLSDNTAGNLLLASFGGPAGLTNYVRSLGDDITRLDRTEPTLNEAAPNDPRDTTSPAAMLETMRQILIGDALKLHSRERLLRWMRATQTGQARLRAGFPKDWVAGDKTGSGENGTANDVAVAVRPNGVPVLIACYLTGSKANSARLNETHAAIGRLVAAALK
jgi:beta-lactamase class A